MPIRVSISGSSAEQELRSLYTWFCDEPEIRRHAHISMTASESWSSDMGIAFDAIQLVVDSGFQVANLTLAYAAWRATRSNTPQVAIEMDGIKRISLDDLSPEILEVILSGEIGGGDE